MSKNKYDESLTIIIIGDSEVGKTSLMKRFTENTFSPKLLSTCGIELFKKIIDIKGKTYLIKIWDTCGQERFQEITHNYYKSTDGILLVYDASNNETFETIYKWMQSIKDICDQNIPVVIVGNKIDLGNETDKNKVYKFQEENINVKMFETSCLTGENVDKVFNELINQIIEYKNLCVPRNTFTLSEKNKNDKEENEKKCAC